MPTQDSTTITPGTSQKTAVASGRITTGNVYVAGDSNLTSSNIKSGVSIFGVSGYLKERQTSGLLFENRSSYSVKIIYTNGDGIVKQRTVTRKTTIDDYVLRGSIFILEENVGNYGHSGDNLLDISYYDKYSGNKIHLYAFDYFIYQIHVG